MYLRAILALSAAFAVCADIPDVSRVHRALPGLPDWNVPPSSADFPDVYVAVPQQSPGAPAQLQPQSRLEIVRYVSGEFAKVVKPLPGGKKGYKILVGKRLDDQALQDALRFQGTAASPGETVQITSVEFRGREIVVMINGGGKKHFHLREHLQVSMGGPMSGPAPQADTREGYGSTLVLDYGRSLPDMSAEDLMNDLSPFLDFSKEHSAAVNWVDTLPPQFKEAIKERQAIVGMNHDMVLAAMGRPDHKVRERDPNGDMTEDWIYGNPPARTIFVTFSGDKVIRVKEYD